MNDDEPRFRVYVVRDVEKKKVVLVSTSLKEAQTAAELTFHGEIYSYDYALGGCIPGTPCRIRVVYPQMALDGEYIPTDLDWMGKKEDV